MKKIVMSHNPIKHAKSFKFAFNGILHALINEPNFRVQIMIYSLSIALGFYFNIERIEWALLVLAMGILLSAEIVNTVVEELMDHMFKEYNDVAKVIKDLSAGFVLTLAITALAVFLIIFGNRLQTLFEIQQSNRPYSTVTKDLNL